KSAPTLGAISFATFWASYGVWLADHSISEESVRAFGLLTAAFVVYLGWAIYEKLAHKQHLIVAAFGGAAYFGASYALLHDDYHAWMGLFAAAVAGVYLMLGMQLWNQRREDMRPVLLTLGIALAFLTLAVPIQFTGFSITLSWAVEAAALVWIGQRTNENRVLWGAFAIYVFVLARLVAFDAFLASPHAVVANLRFLTFFVAALSYWLGAYWAKSQREPAAAVYITGHIVFLTASLLELNDW